MDINYLFHRQQIERSRANATTSDVARDIHDQLAAEYERQIEQVTDGRITFASRYLNKEGALTALAASSAESFKRPSLQGRPGKGSKRLQTRDNHEPPCPDQA